MTTIVSDTSPINYLILIDQIQLLPALFGEIIIPPAVHRELQHPKANFRVRAWACNLPAWATVIAPTKIPSARDLGLGDGETEAIFLAEELSADFIVIDEWQGRKTAKDRGLHTIGTLLILFQAETARLVNFEAAVELLAKTNFRINRDIIAPLIERSRARMSRDP